MINTYYVCSRRAQSSVTESINCDRPELTDPNDMRSISASIIHNHQMSRLVACLIRIYWNASTPHHRSILYFAPLLHHRPYVTVRVAHGLFPAKATDHNVIASPSSLRPFATRPRHISFHIDTTCPFPPGQRQLVLSSVQSSFYLRILTTQPRGSLLVFSCNVDIFPF